MSDVNINREPAIQVRRPADVFGEFLLDDSGRRYDLTGSPNFAGANFTNREFRGVDFSGMVLEDVAFHSCSFVECAFRSTTIVSSRFEECVFRRSDLTQAGLDRVVLSGSVLAGCSLRAATLTEIDARGVRMLLTECTAEDFVFRLDDCEFEARYADLLASMDIESSSDASGSRWSSVRLCGAILSGANFADAVLVNVDFSNAVLVRSKFVGVTVIDCDFSTSTLVKPTSFHCLGIEVEEGADDDGVEYAYDRQVWVEMADWSDVGTEPVSHLGQLDLDTTGLRHDSTTEGSGTRWPLGFDPGPGTVGAACEAG